MEITNNNINRFLAICLFISGLVVIISSIYMYKQIIYCEAVVNEYNKIKDKSYQRLQIIKI